MAFEIVGREQDLASVQAFIGEAEGGTAALVLEGEAGIGKSTLWLSGVRHANERGLRVLSSRPAEAERGLAHVGLGDLFDGVLDEFLPALPPPRRRALEAALLLEDAPAEAVDPRALGIAVRNSLQLLAEDRPVLLAIDDLQWFDAASAGALAFALRRLASSRVRLLLARRLVERAQRSEIERTLGDERVLWMGVGPLSVGAVHRLLRDRLDRVFARQTLLRIHERSGGNPFFALELARILTAEVDPLQPLPFPESLDELVRGRLSGLPATTREALALAAALGTPSQSLLERAGVAADTLQPGIDAHVIERENGTIRFTHPLLSSVLYQDMGEKRRSVHARLAALVEDPLQHARHLALSTETPDTKVADMLDDAASLANDRGASALAAELVDHALRLTPAGEGDERHRRALAAARAHHAGGEWTRAQTIATALLAETEQGPLRAEVLVLLAEFEIDALAAPLLEEALPQAAARPALQVLIHIRLAGATRFTKGFAAAFEDARAALALADDLGDDRFRIEALGVAMWLGFVAGDAEARVFAARARDLALAAGDPDLLKEINSQFGQVLIDSGDLEAARELLEREYDEWHDRDELHSAGLLGNRAWLELWSGEWELAADYAAQARDMSTQYGLESHVDYIPVFWAAAYRGHFELAQQQYERGLELCEQQLGLRPPLYQAVPGLLALWSGDAAAAVEWLAEADRQASDLDWRESSRRPWSADYVEALLELGRIGEAVSVLDVWEADAARLGRRHVLAHVTRCRGLVAAAEGDVARASSLLEQAVEQHEEVGDLFGRSRALLALGVVRRRARQKRTARDAIRAALSGFEQLGAATWVERARGELGRIGGRTREEGLTTAEIRVAALVSEGRTNREVAAALFLGERTVETHLSHVYAKLGVRSRVELARTFRPDEQSSGGLTISS